jgi:polysaccharide biosynthesis transport protein
MTAQQFLISLRYRWRAALTVWGVTLLAVILLAALLMPPQYRASAEILIEQENLDPIAGVALPESSTTSNRMATQVDIVRSARVMQRAIRETGIQNRPELRERWLSASGGQGDYEAWLVERLQKKTDVRPTRDSKVLYVSHDARDPKFAADFVNALVKAYIDTSLELRVERARQYNAFFDERALQLRDRLQQAQEKASEFQRRNDITNLDVEQARLGELSSQVVALQAKSEEAQRRRREAAANPDRMEEVLKDPLVTSVATALAMEQQKLNQLESRLGDRHPQLVELRSTVEAMGARLEAAKRRAAAGFEGGSNVYASQLAERTRALREQSEMVLQRKGVRDQARLLQNDVEAAQRAFDAVVARLNKTALEGSDMQANVSILKIATVPSMTTSASAGSVVAVGAVAGFLLALVAMLAIESRDRRLRNADDILSTLNQNLLIVLQPRRPRGAHSPTRHLVVQSRPALTNESAHAAH